MPEKKAVEFLKNVTGKVGIFFHDDADGCCSAALVLALLRQRGLKPILGSGEIDDSSFKKFSQHELDATIFLDYAIDQYPAWLKPWKDKKVLIVDHHPIQNDLNKSGFIHVNPRFERPSVYISASEVVCSLCAKAGLKGTEWQAHVGAVGDRSIEGNDEEKRAAELIDAVKAIEHERGLVRLAGVLAGMDRIEKFVYSEKYLKIHEKYERELNKQIDKFRTVEKEKVIWFESKTNYSLTSSLATRLFEFYPEKTLFIFSKDSRFCKIAGRTKGHELGKIFRDAAVSVGGKGGGHPVAAGAKIPVGKLDTFRKKVMASLQQ